MTDRFDELALRVFGEMENPNNLRIVETLSAALRAQHKAGQEAMREKAAVVVTRIGHHDPGTANLAATIIGAVLPQAADTFAASIRALPIEDTP